METEVIFQALHYLSKRLNRSVTKLHAIKFIFFADRYHLRKYARMITDDTYYAMKFGPVASNVKDILDFQFDDTEEAGVCGKYIQKSADNVYEAVTASPELDMLSETDIEALDFAINSFKDVDDIAMETHKYPEWLRFEHSIENRHTNREKIVMSDFFEDSINPDDPYNIISDEITTASKEIYFGTI